MEHSGTLIEDLVVTVERRMDNTLGGDHVSCCQTCNKPMYGVCQVCTRCMAHCTCNGRIASPLTAEEFGAMLTSHIMNDIGRTE